MVQHTTGSYEKIQLYIIYIIYIYIHILAILAILAIHGGPAAT